MEYYLIMDTILAEHIYCTPKTKLSILNNIPTNNLPPRVPSLQISLAFSSTSEIPPPEKISNRERDDERFSNLHRFESIAIPISDSIPMLKSNESDLDSAPSTSRSSIFLAPNGLHNPYDMELVSITNRHRTTSSVTINNSIIGGANYTSLRDILPPTPSPPSGISPTHNSSWHEIPIRNPLVKHAAWAYLQPMSAPPHSGDRTFFSKLNSLCCDVGCFEYFTKSISRFFSIRRDSDNEEEEEEENDEDGFCLGGCKVD